MHRSRSFSASSARASDDPSGNRIACPSDDWNGARFGHKRESQDVRDCEDDVGSCCDNLAHNFGETIKSSLGTVPFDDQVAPLDIAKTLHFLEEDRVARITPDAHFSRRRRRI
jgi:hypothetical protein